jgi:leucyl-tRNA synthetase
MELHKRATRENLIAYRLTYLAETVNWCPTGNSFNNDEIVNGVSERGGFTVVRKK